MIDHVRPAQLSAWFAAAPEGSQPLVLDVREPWELQTASVRAEGFELVAIPMGELPARLAELERMQFDAYAARSLVARIGEGAPLGAYPWIHWDERLQADWLAQWLARHAPGATIAMRVDVSAAAMHELIAAGVGVQFLACVEGDADPSLVRVGPMDPFACRDLWVLTLPELRATPRVQAFTDHMVEGLRAPLASGPAAGLASGGPR